MIGKHKIIISLSILFSLSLTLLISCGTAKPVTYRDDVSVLEIYNTLSKVLTTDEELYVYSFKEASYEGAEYAGDSLLKYRIKPDTSICDDCFVCNTGGNSCFEYGVFRATSSENANKLKATVDSYINELKSDELALSYSPDDKIVLQNSSATIVGNYVIYVIISSQASTTATTRLGDLLTKK